MKDSEDPVNTSGRNNNNMAAPSRLIITDPPSSFDKAKENSVVESELEMNADEKMSPVADMLSEDHATEETKTSDEKGSYNKIFIADILVF